MWNLLRVEWEHIKQTRNAKKEIVVAERVVEDDAVSHIDMNIASRIESPRSSSSRERKNII